jgi:hypothetical protein
MTQIMDETEANKIVKEIIDEIKKNRKDVNKYLKEKEKWFKKTADKTKRKMAGLLSFAQDAQDENDIHKRINKK